MQTPKTAVGAALVEQTCWGCGKKFKIPRYYAETAEQAKESPFCPGEECRKRHEKLVEDIRQNLRITEDGWFIQGSCMCAFPPKKFR